MQQDTVRVQLNFPLEHVKKPIIWHLAHEYGIQFSIRRANIDINAGGFTVLELTAPSEKIEAGLEWARSEGIETSYIGLDGTDEWVVR